MLRAARAANPDGDGVAWVENGAVVWEKALSLGGRLDALVAKVPLPFVVHYRIATAGGVSNQLCHPFVIAPGSPLAEKGATDVGVLFHNGHAFGFDAAHEHLEGPVSDSRGVASHLATHAMTDNRLDEKKVETELSKILGGLYAILTPKRLKLVGHWTEQKGIYLSNTSFQRAAIWYGLRPRGSGTRSTEPEPGSGFHRASGDPWTMY